MCPHKKQSNATYVHSLERQAPTLTEDKQNNLAEKVEFLGLDHDMIDAIQNGFIPFNPRPSATKKIGRHDPDRRKIR